MQDTGFSGRWTRHHSGHMGAGRRSIAGVSFWMGIVGAQVTQAMEMRWLRNPMMIGLLPRKSEAGRWSWVESSQTVKNMTRSRWLTIQDRAIGAREHSLPSPSLNRIVTVLIRTI